MRRALVAAAVTLAAVHVATAAPSQACEPGDLHAWWLNNYPGLIEGNTENGLKMEIDGWYVGWGSWKLQIDRPLEKPTKTKKFERIIIESPPDGRPVYEEKGVLKKGDTVKGWTYGKPVGTLMFGNPGCV